MKKTLWTLGLLLVCGLALLWAAQGQAQKQQAARVVVAPVVRKEVSAGRSFVGTVEPLRLSTVGSAVAGRIEELLVEEGDRVTKGQPLARLRTQIIRAELATAEADLRLREAELEELKNGSRPEEIEHARATLAHAESVREYLKRSRERILSSGRAVSSEERDKAVAAAVQADASYYEAKANLKLIEAGPRKEKITQAEARKDSQEAEVRRIREQLERHTIVAPFDGYITAKRAEVGQWLMQGDRVADVAELDHVYVEAAVLEDYVANLRIGSPGRVEVASLPDHVFTGEVAVIVPQADLRARTFPVKVKVANHRVGKSVALKAGLFARVTLPVEKQEGALLVSKDALVLDGSNRQVFVIDPDPKDPSHGTARPVPVRLGIADDSWIQVKADLEPGQVVVVQGNERLRPGQAVEIVRTETGPKK
jgi:HlyD family secretion protein